MCRLKMSDEGWKIMRNIILKIIGMGCFALSTNTLCVVPVSAQLRVPPTSVTALATQSDGGIPVLEAEITPVTPQVTPIQHVVTPQGQTQMVPAQQVVSQPVAPSAQQSFQTAMSQPQVVPQVMPQMGAVPDRMIGVIVIPVIMPQSMTYTHPPVMMMANRPAHWVVPQSPAPMMAPMFDSMAIPMMQPQMMMQQPMVSPPMQPQAPAQQPIPVKMILPDGSTVSIKHYMPGQFFKNVVRAVTP